MVYKLTQQNVKGTTRAVAIVIALIATTTAGTVYAQEGPGPAPAIDLVCGTELVGELACTTGGDKAWVATHDGTGSGPDEVQAMALSPDGSRIFVTAWTTAEGTGADIAVIAYDSDGTQVWTAQFDGPINGREFPHDLAVSPDGSTVFVTGESDGLTTGVDYVTLAFDAETGNQNWATRYEGVATDSWDWPHSVAVSPDGGTVFVTGGSGESLFFTGEIATVAYDAVDGSEVWVQRYASPSTAFFRAAIGTTLGVGPEGNTVYVTGQSAAPGGGFVGNIDFTAIAYDAASGSEVWVARYDGPAQDTDLAQDLALSSDGSRIFVTGSSKDVDDDFATVAYDTTDGAQLWAARYASPVGNDKAWAIGVGPDDAQVFVTGEFRDVQGWHMATVGYDAANGAQMWAQSYHGPGAVLYDTARDLAVAPQGGYLAITGETYGEEGGDLTTVAYSMVNGTELWADRHDGPSNGNDVGLAIAISPDGARVYNGGSVSTPSSSRDAVTIAYDGLTGLQVLGLGPLPVPDVPLGA